MVLIAAVARNGVIGRDNGLPWYLPGDLAHFSRSTIGRPVVMGRRTFDSVGAPLPGRPTIVLSADPAFGPAGVAVARTLGDALDEADRAADACGADSIMIAGGATIYAVTIARADRLVLTTVDAEPAGDTVFPAIDPDLWHCTTRQPRPAGPDDSARYAFTFWERRRPL